MNREYSNCKMKNKLKILHLEDIESDAELVERTLYKSGLQFEISVVDNKAGFIKALKEFSPDIVLSDHSLPSFNSVEAIKIVKEMGLTIPFILITATLSEEFVVDVMLSGADDYILKDRMIRLPGAIELALQKFRLKNEKIKAEKERERLLDILEMSLNEIFIFNPDSLSFEYVNDEALKHLGYTREEITNLTLLDINPGWNEKVFREMLVAIEDSSERKRFLKPFIYAKTKHVTMLKFICS